MRLVESNYQDKLVFIGINNPELPKHEIVRLIERELDIEAGRDFDGIEVEAMSSEHTNTNHDLQAYVTLADEYEFVYFIRLRPVR